jgi:hypothetical protein
MSCFPYSMCESVKKSRWWGFGNNKYKHEGISDLYCGPGPGPQAHRPTNPQAHRPTSSQAHRPTGPQALRATGLQAHRLTGSQAPQGKFPSETEMIRMVTFWF